MTLRFKYIVGLAAVAAGLASCVKEDFENAANGSYDGIQFNISTVDTKTVYGTQASDKSWPLYWVAGDPVRIYCAEAEDAKQADYTVTPTGTNSKTGSMALAHARKRTSAMKCSTTPLFSRSLPSRSFCKPV